MAELSIAEHIITHSAETRTNTRWSIMWWFTRQWVTWRYPVRASCHPLLHQLPKINGGYFSNSPSTNVIDTITPSKSQLMANDKLAEVSRCTPTEYIFQTRYDILHTSLALKSTYCKRRSTATRRIALYTPQGTEILYPRILYRIMSHI
jgi:hypothetical protein